MVRKIKAKQILKRHSQSVSGRAIAGSLGISRSSVAETLGAAADAGVSYADIASKSDDEVCALLFPGRNEHASACRQPDWEAVCVCSIESGPCERVDVFHVSGRFWSTSACGEKRTPARPAWTSFPS